MSAAADKHNRPRKGSPSRLWMRLWRGFTPVEHKRLIGAFVAMLIASAITALLPLLIGALVDANLHGSRVSFSGSLGLLAFAALIVILAQILEVIRRQLVENVATGFERDSRVLAYHRLLKLDLGLLRKDRAGSVYGRANRSIEGAVQLLKLGALDLLPSLTLAVAALIVAFVKEPLVAAGMAGVVPSGFALVRWQVRSQSGIRVEVRDHKDVIDGQVTELLPALDTVRTAGAEDHFLARVDSACGELRSTEMRHHRAMSLFDAAKSINEGFWLVAVLCTAIALAANGSISAGEITAYVMLFAAVLTPLRDLHRILDEASEAALQTRDLFDLIDAPVDRSYARVASAGLRPRQDPAALEIRKLHFTHEGQDEEILSALDLSLGSRERVGLVGESGCGKSTLLRLVARLHHGYEGQIEVFGTDLQQLERARLAEIFGYVSQEPKIFYGSVRDNICLGLEVSEKELFEAATRAHIHETILAMPDGYETVVAERGDSVSGGQRQRICLARTLLRKPRLLLLDEPTSALDNSSERVVQRAIDDLDEVAMLVVAHRLSTLRNTDRVVVLDQGQLVEAGRFSELAAADGHFAAMLASEEPESRALGAQLSSSQQPAELTVSGRSAPR
jgi:ATP-binding cassette subfamily B protein